MANQQAVDLLFISLLILVLILVVLVMLCWVFKHFKNRNLTELRILVGQPPLRMAIRTKPEHALELMDHLMDRFIFQEETGPCCEEASSEECGQDNKIESTVTSNLFKPLNIFPKKMFDRITVALPSRQARKAPNSSTSPYRSQAEIHAPQQQDDLYNASSSCQGAFSSENNNEDKHEEETCL